MDTLDIRDGNGAPVTRIKFSDDYESLIKGDCLTFSDSSGNQTYLCWWKDFDNFIAACHKARELWGPK